MMWWFTRRDRALLHAIWRETETMALNFSNLQAAVTQLSTDVQAFIAAHTDNSAADQAAVDAVTKSLADLDAAVKAAAPTPAPAA